MKRKIVNKEKILLGKEETEVIHYVPVIPKDKEAEYRKYIEHQLYAIFRTIEDNAAKENTEGR